MSDQTLATRRESLAKTLGIPFGLSSKTMDDPEEVMLRIAEEIASQQTVDAVLKSGLVESVSDHLGEPFELRGFRFQGSDYSDWPYAVIEAANRDGEPTTLVCGGQKVLIKLARIATLDGFPCAARFTSTGIDLEDGGKGQVYDLVPV